VTLCCPPQSIFYIICFRHRSILEADDGRAWLRSLDLRRLIHARSNPLRVCAPQIVQLFVHIMHDTKVTIQPHRPVHMCNAEQLVQ
jgi:hypothetical protein